MSHQNKITALLTAGILSLACLSKSVIAAELNQSVKFNIEPQALETALLEFSRQAGIQVFGPAQGVAGKQAPGVRGEQVVEDALRSLLKDSGLTYRTVNKQTVAIGPMDGVPAAVTAQGSDDVLRVAQADTSAAAAGASSESKPGTSGPGEEDGTKLEEVVVTAQKREERLKDVPISISVMRGEDLDQSTVQGISDALNRVPGVATSITALGNPQVIIRGVTSSGLLGAGSSTVAYYLDSVPFGFVRSALVPDSNAYDLERVEVLRGPQGTLYGASAMNGVVRVLTKDANLNQFDLKARASTSSTEGGSESYRGDLAVNVPLVEGKAAIRAVLGYQDLSGWIDKPNKENANDGELENFRLKMNAQPTENLSVVSTVWLSRTDFGSQSISDVNGRATAELDESFTADYDAYGLKVGYDFSAFSLSSATSYLAYSITSGLDLNPFGFPVSQLSKFDSQVLAQEVNLNSSLAGPWRWSVGGIYRDNDDRTRRRYSAFVLPTDYSDLSESFAIYGEVTRLIQDGRFEITAGLRYFDDEVTNAENLSFTGDPNAALVQSSATFTATTPRAILTWHPNSQATVYASYSEGFRSGFTQLPSVLATAPQFAPLDADSLQNLELGTKGSAWNGRLGFDFAVYYIDWQDVQQYLGVLVNNFPVDANINGTSASGKGLEFAVTTEPLQGLELGVNFSWNDLSMDSDVISAGAVLFRKGDRLDASPEYTAGASADYAFPLGGKGYKGRFSFSANYISAQDQRIPGPPGGLRQIVPADNMLVARTSFSIDSPDHWQATLFVDNLNKERGTPVFPPFGVEEWAARIRPRTIGAQLEYRF